MYRSFVFDKPQGLRWFIECLAVGFWWPADEMVRKVAYGWISQRGTFFNVRLFTCELYCLLSSFWVTIIIMYVHHHHLSSRVIFSCIKLVMCFLLVTAIQSLHGNQLHSFLPFWVISQVMHFLVQYFCLWLYFSIDLIRAARRLTEIDLNISGDIVSAWWKCVIFPKESCCLSLYKVVPNKLFYM